MLYVLEAHPEQGVRCLGPLRLAVLVVGPAAPQSPFFPRSWLPVILTSVHPTSLWPWSS